LQAKQAHDRQEARAQALAHLGEENQDESSLLRSALAWMKPRESIAGVRLSTFIVVHELRLTVYIHLLTGY
jgi:hypothetical protein